MPRKKQKGKFVRPEAEVLEGMRLAFFDDLEVLPEEEPVVQRQQMTLGYTRGEDTTDTVE